MQRGDVFWFEPDPVLGSEQAGRRPAIVLTRDAVNSSSPVIIVLPMTTFRGQSLYPSDVMIQAPEGGLRQDSVAVGLQLRAIDRRRLGQRLGRVGGAILHEIEEAVLQVLDIQRP
jgi:mRNA interferase MazF